MNLIKFINDNHYILEEKTDIYNFLESMNKQYILTDFEKNIVLSSFNEKCILYPKIVRQCGATFALLLRMFVSAFKNGNDKDKKRFVFFCATSKQANYSKSVFYNLLKENGLLDKITINLNREIRLNNNKIFMFLPIYNSSNACGVRFDYCFIDNFKTNNKMSDELLQICHSTMPKQIQIVTESK